MVKSRAARRAGSSTIRELLALTDRPGVVSLAGGLPNPRSFPAGAVETVVADLGPAELASALQYGPTEGDRPLRERVAELVDATGGVAAEDVQITNGAQQALDLTFRALLDPGDVVAVGEAAYVGAVQALRAAGNRLTPIPTDAEGLHVDRLAEQLQAGTRIDAVYVVSSFDNPTGATLSGERRRRLGDLADRHGFWIIDDDPYGALRWAGTAPAALRDRSDRVISIGTTSKVLCPGLRVGWVVGPSEARAAVTQLKQAADLHTSSLDQRIVERLLAQPHLLDGQVNAARELYATQCRALASSLGRHLGPAIHVDRPDGGLFLWARLDDDVATGHTTTDLLDAALESGTAFVPGEAFATGATTWARHLRLSFATGGPDELDLAARRLGAALGLLDPDAAQ